MPALLGRSAFDFIADTPSGKLKTQKLFPKLVAGEEVRSEELEVRRADGEQVWVSLSFKPIRDARGQVIADRSQAEDITARKRLEEALQRYSEKLQELVDERTAQFRQSEERQRAAAVADDASHKSLQEKVMEEKIYPSNAVAHHRAEDVLRESEARLEMFFSQSLDGFFFMMLDEPVRWDDTVDKDKVLDYVFLHQRMTKVNDAMLAQYGATREQFLGLTPNDFYEHNLAHGREMWRRFFEAGRLHVETDERKLDGTPISIEGDYLCFYDSAGRITGHFGIQRDVTGRKRAEEALRQYNQRLRTLQEIDRAILAARAGANRAGGDAPYSRASAVFARERVRVRFHGRQSRAHRDPCQNPNQTGCWRGAYTGSIRRYWAALAGKSS